MKFSIIVAANHLGIGAKGSTPWRLKKDMDYFKRVTTDVKDKEKKNCVIMGSKTYLSIPTKFRPLVGRFNIVISRNPKFKEEKEIPSAVLVASSLEEALKSIDPKLIETVFVIGGGQIYAEAIKKKECEKIYYTDIMSPKFACDVFFPEIDLTTYALSKREGNFNEEGFVFAFLVYERLKGK